MVTSGSSKVPSCNCFSSCSSSMVSASVRPPDSTNVPSGCLMTSCESAFSFRSEMRAAILDCSSDPTSIDMPSIALSAASSICSKLLSISSPLLPFFEAPNPAPNPPPIKAAWKAFVAS